MGLHINKEDHVQGDKNAPVVRIEYGDFQCPYCRKAHYIVKGIQKELGDKVAFVFRNFPLTDLHPNALHAAIAAEVAGAQGKFWEMYDILFENQKFLDDSYLMQYAKIVGLNANEFEQDFEEDEFYDKVKDDYESGEHNGVEGTPTFFINGKLFEGNWMDPGFVEHVKKAIK